MNKGGKHPGFKAAAESIQKREGVSKEAADKILAAAARKAGKGAKEKNPRLNKVKTGRRHGNDDEHDYR